MPPSAAGESLPAPSSLTAAGPVRARGKRRCVTVCRARSPIGTSAQVGWHESTVFCSAFYGALFRRKGKGLSPAEQAEDAAKRAQDAYTLLTDRHCPYRAMTLGPSTRAKKVFA